jgi:hypothetical protein
MNKKIIKLEKETLGIILGVNKLKNTFTICF